MFLNAILKSFLIALIAIIFSSCNQPSNSNKTNQADTFIKAVTRSDAKTDNDTLIIDQSCAVFVTADSLQIAKRKKELGQDFYTGADDYAFYLNEAQNYFDSVKLKTIDCNGKKYLKFIYADKKQELIILTNLDELWKVYLFDPNKKSKNINMAMVDEGYKNYFK